MPAGCYVPDLSQQEQSKFTSEERVALLRVPYGEQQYAGFIPNPQSRYSTEYCDSCETATACNTRMMVLPCKCDGAPSFWARCLVATRAIAEGESLVIFSNPDNQVFDLEGHSMIVNRDGDRVQGSSYFRQ
jgi:hypothetical protein